MKSDIIYDPSRRHSARRKILLLILRISIRKEASLHPFINHLRHSSYDTIPPDASAEY
jgi:hypothetical protein